MNEPFHSGTCDTFCSNLSHFDVIIKPKCIDEVRYAVFQIKSEFCVSLPVKLATLSTICTGII